MGDNFEEIEMNLRQRALYLLPLATKEIIGEPWVMEMLRSRCSPSDSVLTLAVAYGQSKLGESGFLTDVLEDIDISRIAKMFDTYGASHPIGYSRVLNELAQTETKCNKHHFFLKLISAVDSSARLLEDLAPPSLPSAGNYLPLLVDIIEGLLYSIGVRPENLGVFFRVCCAAASVAAGLSREGRFEEGVAERLLNAMQQVLQE